VSEKTSGHVCALVTILIWGTTFISTKVLLDTLTPLEILFGRFLLGYLALLMVRPRMLRPGGLRRELLFAAAGLCGVTLYFLLENLALTHTLASNVGVVVSVSPVFTALLAHLFLDGERLTARFFAGFAAAMGGICLVTFHGADLRLEPLGDMLALLAAAVWAGYSVLMRRIGARGLDHVLCTRRIFSYGLLFMLPALGLLPFRFSPALLAGPGVLPNLLYLGLGASALCFVTWNRAVSMLGAMRTSAYIYLVPFITVLFSSLILKEPFTPRMAGGMALTLAGVLLSEGKFPGRRKEVASFGRE